ncbi:MoaF-related domain-containing protein [Flavihumibacter sp.]|uniref:MoaF-related domain-containing protein n=1 Tax=Flavihumibacter sp. TaxID=1913981 RepID=UPI002FC5BF15
MKSKLTGNRYKMDVGVLKTELYFESDEAMVFTVLEGGELTKNGYSERVETVIAEIRPQVYMVAWKEISGATVTHVEDHENGIIYSNATLPDGSFYTLKGSIQQI